MLVIYVLCTISDKIEEAHRVRRGIAPMSPVYIELFVMIQWQVQICYIILLLHAYYIYNFNTFNRYAVAGSSCHYLLRSWKCWCWLISLLKQEDIKKLLSMIHHQSFIWGRRLYCINAASRDDFLRLPSTHHKIH